MVPRCSYGTQWWPEPNNQIQLSTHDFRQVSLAQPSLYAKSAMLSGLRLHWALHHQTQHRRPTATNLASASRDNNNLLDTSCTLPGLFRRCSNLHPDQTSLQKGQPHIAPSSEHQSPAEARVSSTCMLAFQSLAAACQLFPLGGAWCHKPGTYWVIHQRVLCKKSEPGIQCICHQHQHTTPWLCRGLLRHRALCLPRRNNDPIYLTYVDKATNLSHSLVLISFVRTIPVVQLQLLSELPLSLVLPLSLALPMSLVSMCYLDPCKGIFCKYPS